MNDVLLFNSGSIFDKAAHHNLKKHFKVKTITFSLRRPLSIIKFISEMRRSKCFYKVFGELNGAIGVGIAKVLGKKAIIEVGGYEVAHDPTIGYGWAQHPFKNKISGFALRFCDQIIVCSQSTYKEVTKYFDVDPKKITLVYHAFNPLPEPKAEKEDLVLTVGGINELTLKKKGIENFVDVAKLVPEYKFILVGKIKNKKIENYLKSIASNNLEIKGYVTNKELNKIYSKSKVYVQISAHESFGWTVAESMLHKCVPVLTNRFALPEVGGNIAYYVKYGDIKETAKAIRLAMHSGRGSAGRKRILERFAMKKRVRKITKIVSKTIKS